ncbi:hypothetical protein D5047_11360 [Verminephrobacter eiseniae]|nr:hypothetical protein [Verminephrobacter eiseniae]
MAARPSEAARVVRQPMWARAMGSPDGVGGELTVTCVVAQGKESTGRLQGGAMASADQSHGKQLCRDG